MAQYQVATIGRPKNWEPECPDDVPLEFQGPVGVLAESDDLFEAVRRAIEHNESVASQQQNRWAVVIEPSSPGRIWPAARLCTPITYKVTTICWPEGWEPNSPRDVPNCVWQTKQQCGEPLDYPQAEATALALNRQCIDHPGTTWHVVVAVENEALSRMVCYDPTSIETTKEVRRMHVVRPEQGGHGDCRHCPAHAFDCTKAEWSSRPLTVSACCSRASGAAMQ
jgi:hypothetical protein